ncbi:hypothetical protein POG22_03600 [Geitlerinema sp. CS-897]|nr:hypothetical protein [Geitlerinema sp. CS-897]
MSTGAAAYSATMAALGGLGVMTGGAALIAGGAGFAIWQLLKKTKDNPDRIIKLLEASMYTVSEEMSHPVLTQIKHHLSDLKNISIAPNIPLDRLIDEIADMGGLGKTEKVFACLDLKLLGIKQGSMLLTDSRILWKKMWDSPKARLYRDWKHYKESIPQLGEERADRALKRFLAQVSNL